MVNDEGNKNKGEKIKASLDLNYYYNNILNNININRVATFNNDRSLSSLLQTTLPFPTALSPSLSSSSSLSISKSVTNQNQNQNQANIKNPFCIHTSSSNNNNENNNNSSRNSTSTSNHINTANSQIHTKSDLILNISLFGASKEIKIPDTPNPNATAQSTSTSTSTSTIIKSVGSESRDEKKEERARKTIIGTLLSPSFNSIAIGEGGTRTMITNERDKVREKDITDRMNENDVHILPLKALSKTNVDMHMDMDTDADINIGTDKKIRHDNDNVSVETICAVRTVQVQERVIGVSSINNNSKNNNNNNNNNSNSNSSININSGYSTNRGKDTDSTCSVGQLVSNSFTHSVMVRGMSCEEGEKKSKEIQVDKVEEKDKHKGKEREKRSKDSPYSLFTSLCDQAKDQFSNDVSEVLKCSKIIDTVREDCLLLKEHISAYLSLCLSLSLSVCVSLSALLSLSLSLSLSFSLSLFDFHILYFIFHRSFSCKNSPEWMLTSKKPLVP